MGDLLPFVHPREDKKYSRAAGAASDAVYYAVQNQHGEAYCGDMTIGMARAVYQIFYRMRECLPPNTVCEEVDFFAHLMRENLPKLKERLWAVYHEKDGGAPRV